MTRITDEAVEAAAIASQGGIWRGVPEYVKADIRDRQRAALEAALPHMEGATPVVSRERLAEVLDPTAFDQTKKRSKQPAAVIQWAARQHMAYEGADRLLAAGVFREGATPAIDPNELRGAYRPADTPRGGDRDEQGLGLVTSKPRTGGTGTPERCRYCDLIGGHTSDCPVIS